MSEYTTSITVWRDGLDIPWAIFDTEEEADVYIRRCQEEDQLEEEFRAVLEDFAERVAQRLGIDRAEATGMVRALASLYK
jgi:hypothetical protein